jgi:2'-5' RNA ligase
VTDAADSAEAGRLFVAVWPPEVVLDQIAALPRSAEGLRWTTRDQWHVTLRFLGRTTIAPAVEALVELDGQPACPVTIAGPARRLGRGAFALPVDGLAPLALATIAAFDGIGRPAEPRPFRGHLTLARVKDARPRVLMPSLAFEASWTVRSVCLVRSHLARSGARYETIASADLAVV